jgi:hypothetical protein
VTSESVDTDTDRDVLGASNVVRTHLRYMLSLSMSLSSHAAVESVAPNGNLEERLAVAGAGMLHKNCGADGIPPHTHSACTDMLFTTPLPISPALTPDS